MAEKPAERRILETRTKNLEKRLIVALLKIMPRWVTPDGLTILGIISAAGITATYILARGNRYWLWVGSALVVVHWFADSLDGALAKYRQKPRQRYGHYVDRICDFITLILVSSGVLLYGVHPLAALLLLASYGLIFMHSLLQHQEFAIMQLSFSGVGPTEARIGLIILNTALFFGYTKLITVVLFVVTALALLTASINIHTMARRLDREDRALWPKQD